MCPPAAESNFGLSERPQFWGGVVRVTIRRHNFVHSSFVGIRNFETVTTSKHRSTADRGNAYPAPSRHILNQNICSFECQCPFLCVSSAHGVISCPAGKIQYRASAGQKQSRAFPYLLYLWGQLGDTMGTIQAKCQK